MHTIQRANHTRSRRVRRAHFCFVFLFITNIFCENHSKIIPSEPAKNAGEENKRKELMKLIADTSSKQGDFRLSSKLYTKLGNQVEAMKCLINLGAIDEVVNYATMARMP